MELSARLEAVAGMVTKDNRVCDVGCDHGYISIYLVKNGISPYVYAMDVNQGPLERAQEHIVMYGLGDKVETILSDGLVALGDRESDTLICAGMGGKLVIKILTEGMEKVCKMKELILQPQSEIHLVRAFLRKQGFYIDKEDMVFEDGKYYPMMHVLVHSNQKNEDNAVSDKFGPVLLREKHPVLKEFLEYTKNTLDEIDKKLAAEEKTDKIEKRIAELKVQQKEVEDALGYFKG
ncbi:MAG: SAM-dependent methyltransferase [Lachnospiraceae bacterium]|nr:SAM-dependent methyltransferase [Lachnospiraceae bacterium]